MPTITALEDALIALIKAAALVKTVESYSGQLEGDPKDIAKRWPEIIRRWPAVFVAYGGGAIAPELGEFGGVYGRTLQFDLMVCCRSLRGEAAARRDDTGAYAILEALRTILVGKVLTSAVLPLEFQSEEARSISPDSVIYRATYTLQLEDQMQQEE